MKEVLNQLVVEVRNNSGLIKALDGKVDILADKVDRNGVLLETVDEKIIKLAEGQEALHEKTDDLRGVVSKVEEKIEQIDGRLICVEVVPK